MQYRREIDGLRAVAVIPVIFFHADFTLFSGGYVGVDIFFVISGYLITSIIIEELEQGEFSILHFYERRARRILPALFFVMLCCIPFAWMWMLPSQLKAFSQSLIAVSVFVSNIFFWRESGYFAAASETKPLLHTWSLAVEEQYYVLFPIFLILFWRFGRNPVYYSILFISIISLLLSEWGWRNHHVANFYLTPTRVWELLAGSICALLLFGKAQKPNNLMSAFGLALIVSAIFFYDENTPFPSIYALTPVVGTALIIMFGAHGTWVAQLLSRKLFVGIGLVSYSAYLWHQPLFAFARVRSLYEPEQWLMVLLSATSLAMAYFSWRYIERPFRKQTAHAIGTQRAIFGLAGTCSAAFIIVGLFGHYEHGYTTKHLVPSFVEKTFIRSARETECFDKPSHPQNNDWHCPLGDDSKNSSFVVFGDSHALSVLDSFDTAALTIGRGGIFIGASGCTPFLGIFSINGYQTKQDCHALNERVFDYVKSSKTITTVFLVARWTYYTNGSYNGRHLSYISDTWNGRPSVEASRSAFQYGLGLTVEAYQNIGINLVIIPQVPQQRIEPRDIYRRAYESDKIEEVLRSLSVSLADHERLQSFVSAAFARYGNNLQILSLEASLCKEGVCLVGEKNRSLYFDSNHLSQSGSRLAIPVIERYLMGAPP